MTGVSLMYVLCECHCNVTAMSLWNVTVDKNSKLLPSTIAWLMGAASQFIKSMGVSSLLFQTLPPITHMTSSLFSQIPIHLSFSQSLCISAENQPKITINSTDANVTNTSHIQSHHSSRSLPVTLFTSSIGPGHIR